MKNEKYFKSMVGGLISLTHTQPNLMFIVSIVSRYMHNPSKNHFGTTKRILRYVQGAINYVIMYEKDKSCELLAFIERD